MSILSEIRSDIIATRVKFLEAELANNEALILMYGQNLIELRRTENRLLAGEYTINIPHHLYSFHVFLHTLLCCGCCFVSPLS